MTLYVPSIVVDCVVESAWVAIQERRKKIKGKREREGGGRKERKRMCV